MNDLEPGLSLKPEMQRQVDDYLRRLRRGLRGASTEVAEEAELEIRTHVEDGLAELGEPDLGQLRALLERLGRPEELGRDMALYMMVDRGYHDWSLPHMLRSTAFWAFSTLAGAVVVLIFGALYAMALVLAASGGIRLLARAGLLEGEDLLLWIRALPGQESIGPSLAVLLLGVLGSLLLGGIVRWFVGQYLRHAGPQMGSGEGDGGGSDWPHRAERWILGIAASGMAVHLLAGMAAGVYGLRLAPGPVADPVFRPDFTASPLSLLSGIGLLILALAPVLGALIATRERD